MILAVLMCLRQRRCATTIVHQLRSPYGFRKWTGLYDRRLESTLAGSPKSEARSRSSPSSWVPHPTGRRCSTPSRCSNASGCPREAHRLGAPHAGLDGRVRHGRRGARHRSDRRRRRRRGASAGHGGGAYGAAGAGRAGAERGAPGARFAAVDRADAGRRAGRHAGDRQAWRDERGAAGGVDPGQLAARAAREAARVSRRADREGPAGRCHDFILVRGARPCRSSHRAPRSACSAAVSSDACSPSPPGAWATASTHSRQIRTRRPAR